MFRPSGAARELWSSARLGATYPKTLTARLHRPPDGVAPDASGQVSTRMLPVVLLHGFLQNAASLDALGAHLRGQGFACYPINYKTLGPGVERAGDALVPHLRGVLAAAGTDRAYIVAHSMGGLVARAALRHPEAAGRVAGVVTLGTPHAGTPLARLAGRVAPPVARLIGDFMPGSPVLCDLDASPDGGQAAWVAVYSTDDQVVPGRCGRLDCGPYAAENIEVHGVGHSGLVYEPRMLALVADVLRAWDDGLAHPER